MADASMEPQGLGCGVETPIPDDWNRRVGFNGATGFRLWSPFSRHNWLTTGQILLQWSHRV